MYKLYDLLEIVQSQVFIMTVCTIFLADLPSERANGAPQQEQDKVATMNLRTFWRSTLQRIYERSEPVSIVHYTVWIQYQAAHPKVICFRIPCKLACCLPQK